MDPNSNINYCRKIAPMIVQFGSMITYAQLIICEYIDSRFEQIDKRELKRLQMTPILAICREEKISMKKSLYGIGFVTIFSIVTNLQMFWFYGIRTDINMDLNCNQTFYLWSVLIPAMVIRFLVPMIILTVTNVLTIRKVFTFTMRKNLLN